MTIPSHTHVVTGATGFLGGALVLELLRRTDAEILCLSRPLSDAEAAEARIRGALRRAAIGYGCPELIEAIEKRCHTLPADILAPRCGVDPAHLPAGAELWHCAASLEYGDEQRDKIFAHNLGGTRHVIELACRSGVAVLNYVSTAYVAGSRTGRILEAPPGADTVSNNSYEASKIAAEHAVASSGIATRALRPSVVVGHSKTAYSVNASGYYGYIRRMRSYRRFLMRYDADALSRPVRLQAMRDCPIDLMPVDAVAAASVAISLSSPPGGIYHMTNAEPPTVGTALACAHRVLGLPDVEYVSDRHAMTRYEQRLDDGLVFYQRYMNSPKDFDRAHTDAALTPAASAWPMDEVMLRRLAATYLESLATGGHSPG
jgi:nucleoside-diphosphate-sugar epimerase